MSILFIDSLNIPFFWDTYILNKSPFNQSIISELHLSNFGHIYQIHTSWNRYEWSVKCVYVVDDSFPPGITLKWTLCWIVRFSNHNLDDENLAAHPSSYLDPVTKCLKDNLVKFSISKTKLVTFHYHWADSKLSSVKMVVPSWWMSWLWW